MDSKETNSGRGAAISSPQLSLPKDGGAVRGIGEKFTANPANGTGSMSVPPFASPRSATASAPELASHTIPRLANGVFVMERWAFVVSPMRNDPFRSY
jgi:hypothetical protein